MCVDDIMLLKPFNDCLSGPITGSINKSVNTGSFPRELKTATITLTLKPGIFQYCVVINISIVPVSGVGQNIYHSS